MKRICSRVLVLLLAAALLCGSALAAEQAAWGSIQGETAVLYLPGTEGEDFSCQVGSAWAEVASAAPVSSLESPVETIVLLDNSLSITQDQQPVIKELLSDLIANRLTGEKYTIATVSDQANYLCTGESDYTSLKTIVDGITFQNQYTQLTDSLYQVLDSLKSSDTGVLRRLLIVADGVDNKEVGYTQSELEALIRELGYPIYTVGCLGNSPTVKEDLQNLFALSRITTGGAYYLPELQTMDIVSGVISWNNAVRLVVQLPAEVCDGMPKALRVTDNTSGNTYTTELKMPLAELQQPVETPAVPEESEPAQEPDPEPTPDQPPAGRSDIPWSLVLVVVLAGAVLALGIVLLLRRKKTSQRIVETPEAVPPTDHLAKTEFIGPETNGGLGQTEGIWSDGTPTLRLVFQNLDNPGHRIETALDKEILVGRDASACQVVLTEPSVARKQCRVYLQGSWVMVANLSHSNITKLNGLDVTEDCELVNEGVLQMGRVRMRVEIIRS